MAKNNGIAVTLNGVTYPSRYAAYRALGLPAQVVGMRFKNGWSIEEAFGLKHRYVKPGPKPKGRKPRVKLIRREINGDKVDGEIDFMTLDEKDYCYAARAWP